jgi:IQ and AAA domain-containing protein
VNEADNQWQFIDENRHEAPIHDWITLDAFADVHQQQRLIIDDLMRIELELLRLALSRDQRTKYKPSKRKNPKKQKKKKKQRESIDLVTEQGLEERYQELKSMNVNCCN